MKKNILIGILFLLMESAYAQEPILSERVKTFYQLREQMTKAWSGKHELGADCQHAVANFGQLHQRLLQEYSDLYEPEKRYLNYADLLAECGRLQEAVTQYDNAFYHKSMTAEEFGYKYRREYFATDTLLYQQKMREYREKEYCLYTYAEIEVRKALNAILAMDQMAIKITNQPYGGQTVEILHFKDSIVKAELEALAQKYPEIPHILSLDFTANFVLGRHLYSADPQYWLDNEEPRCRANLLVGKDDPKSYAYTYDQCIIRATGGLSFYGEGDNGGLNANPDTALVNKRRANIGLPPLEEKKKENTIFIVY